MVLSTLIFALLSASLRGAISVIDRLQFGHHRKQVGFTNVLNNILTLGLALSIAGYMGQTVDTFHFATDIRVIAFGLLLQLSANAFSYAFRHMNVPSIIIFSKLPDFFIPIVIWSIFKKWDRWDFLFSASTFFICLPLVWQYRRQREIHWISAIGICIFLILQGGLTPWYMVDVSNNHDLWLPFTTALILWRLIFSIFMISPKTWSIQNLTEQNFSLLASRATLTLGAQSFLVLALSQGKPVLAWPILNSTGLISVLLSSLFLKEHASPREYAVILIILVLGAVKVLA